MDVWIETAMPRCTPSPIVSRPTRACGLKLHVLDNGGLLPSHAPHGRVD